MLWFVLLAVLGLGLLVLVHEFGHFVAAKLSGISVATFSIGFGKPLWKKEIGATQYQIAPFFFGGYVEMVGQSDSGKAASKQLDHFRETRSADGFRLLNDPRGWFCNRPGWAQLAVAAGGPAASFLFTIVVMTVLLATFGTYTPVNPPTLSAALPNTPAYAAGMQPQDQILAVNGEDVEFAQEITMAVALSGGSELSFRVQRGNEQLNVPMTPIRNPSLGPRSAPFMVGMAFLPQEVKPKDVSVIEACWESVKEVGSHIAMTAIVARLLVTGDVPLTSLSGPVGIVEQSTGFVRSGLIPGLLFLAFLSTALGATQLIPFPPLDGAHILFASWKMLTGRRVHPKLERVLMSVGVLLAVSLMLVVTAKDVFMLTV